jgi:hypothetical protein
MQIVVIVAIKQAIPNPKNIQNNVIILFSFIFVLVWN